VIVALKAWEGMPMQCKGNYTKEKGKKSTGENYHHRCGKQRIMWNRNTVNIEVA
jgi:hypothetical protein